MFKRKPREQDPLRDTKVPELPAQCQPELTRGEKVLASAQEDNTGVWIVLTTYRILTMAENGDVQVNREWHEVDTGSWDPDTFTLSASWIDSVRGLQWQLRKVTGPGRIPEVFRERVSASVILVREVNLGSKRTARITIRKILATRELIDQVILGRAAHGVDPELAAATEEIRQELRGQAGLSPV